MNKIIRKVLITVICVLELVVLSSCQYFSYSKKPINIPYKSLKSVDFSKNQENNYDFTYYDIKEKGHNYLNSLGKNNILVVPVLIDKYLDSYDINKIKEDLETIYFKNNNSLSSFYDKSSYSLLCIDGEVLDPIGPYEYNSLLKNENILIEDMKKYIDEELITKYDNDKNGRIDYLSFLYLAPPNEKTNYWAHTIKNFKGQVDNYSFISIDFIYEDNELSNSTISHELGHALGLDDYYNADNLTHNPIGECDMMSDCYIMHNVFSKFALGWAKPTLMDSDEIVLKPINDYPSFLLIGNNYNGNAFSEYLIIEYYNDYKGLKGARLFHVDARLLYSTQESLRILNNYSGEKDVVVAHSNTPSYSPLYHSNKNEEAYIPLIELIDKSGRSHLKYEYTLSQESLFTKGDDIKISDISFYSGKRVNYNLFIKELTDDYLVITKK